VSAGSFNLSRLCSEFIKVVKHRWMRWRKFKRRHRRDQKCIHILAAHPGRKKTLGRPRWRWEGHI
jgi:hypothetical protein